MERRVACERACFVKPGHLAAARRRRESCEQPRGRLEVHRAPPAARQSGARRDARSDGTQRGASIEAPEPGGIGLFQWRRLVQLERFRDELRDALMACRRRRPVVGVGLREQALICNELDLQRRKHERLGRLSQLLNRRKRRVKLIGVHGGTCHGYIARRSRLQTAVHHPFEERTRFGGPSGASGCCQGCIEASSVGGKAISFHAVQ